MGRLIVSAQMTMDGVMDQLEGWFDEQGAVEQHGVEELRAADAVLLGRETYEQLSTFWPSAEGPYGDRTADLERPTARLRHRGGGGGPEGGPRRIGDLLRLRGAGQLPGPTRTRRRGALLALPGGLG